MTKEPMNSKLWAAYTDLLARRLVEAADLLKYVYYHYGEDAAESMLQFVKQLNRAAPKPLYQCSICAVHGKTMIAYARVNGRYAVFGGVHTVSVSDRWLCWTHCNDCEFIEYLEYQDGDLPELE